MALAPEADDGEVGDRRHPIELTGSRDDSHKGLPRHEVDVLTGGMSCACEGKNR